MLALVSPVDMDRQSVSLCLPSILKYILSVGVFIVVAVAAFVLQCVDVIMSCKIDLRLGVFENEREVIFHD